MHPQNQHPTPPATGADRIDPSSPAATTAKLSRGQRAMWFLWSLNPAGAEYGLPMAWTIHSALDLDAFRAALQDLVDRHPVLRTTYAAHGGEPVQLIHAQGQADFAHHDASQWDAAALHARLAQEADTGFDLKHGPVFRARLFSRAADTHVLFLNSHHIAADTWSLIVMMEELGLCYRARVEGKAADLPSTGLAYVDYVEWQQNLLASSTGENHAAYWKQQLQRPPVLDLPTDRPRPPVQTHVGAGHAFELDRTLTQQIRALARQHDVTFYTVLMAALYVLLHRYTGQDDIVVGSPRFGRPPQGYARTVGYFASPCALRANVNGESTFEAFLQHMRAVLVGAKEHQDYPFPLLVEQLGIARDASRSPVFQVSFTYQKAHLDNMRGVAAARMGLGGATLDLAGLPLASYPLEQHGVKFDLDFVVEEVDGRLRAVCWYNTALWDAQSIGYLVDHYRTLIAGAVEAPQTALRHLPMLTARESTDYAAWNATESRFPQSPAHRLVEDWAQRQPHAAALVCDSQTVSYAELNARANQLAHHLRRLDLKSGQLVGVSMERGPGLVIAILAVLKAGGAYLPLDPGYPADRLAYMQDDSGLNLLLTDRGANASVSSASVRRLCVDTDAAAIADESTHNLDLASKPDDLAYVIYTSGSTGRPKGVMLEHYGLSNMVHTMAERFAIGTESRLLQFASASFDSSVAEIFSTLCAGAALCLASKADMMPGSALIGTIARLAVTVITLPPSVLALMQPDDVPTLRTVAAAGEACSLDIVKRWAPGRRFLNAYGPTEATVCATVAPLTADSRRVSLGRPIANTRIYLLDAQLQRVPVGIAGEIHIAGVGLARGYLNRPDLTAERFIANPFEGAQARMYKTGDLARFLPDGSLEYLGRIDHQVKIRGFRIELGEVEAVIAACAGVREALVIARATNGGAPSLLAYAIASEKDSISVSDIRAHAQDKLPEFMLPSAIMLLDAWPLTPNGKIDRAALPDASERVTTHNVLAPRDTLEQQIADVWKTVLKLDVVGIDDNFFEVGGHSLDLVRVEIELEQVLGRHVPTMDLFRFPNIRALAAHLRGAQASPADASPNAQRQAAPKVAPIPGNTDHSDTDIAIIGMAGRFPGAQNVDDLWRNLVAGVESVQDLSDSELLAAGVDPALLADPRYVKRKGLLDNVDQFDAAFFGYPPREALLMDPQQRLFLETGWQALEHAGYANASYAGRIGVVGGVGRSAYLLHYLDTHPESAAELFQTTILNEKDFLSTRLAYKLNLRGPALTVQTACSTSLVAVHLACQQLLLDECEIALAGGVSIEIPHGTGYLHQEGHILSSDGRCRPFDSRAQGTVRGSGGAIVVLKRLAAALADGDHVWAVIKGSAINNDGNAKVGFTAPAADGQADVIDQALQRAGVAPDSIGFVEAHGTATPLGDPIEVHALTRAWRRYTGERQFCALGSLKSNVGHLDAAAGVAGLIKAALALHHGKIPATLHFASANPRLELESSPFWVNNTLTDWPSAATPRRAAVSSFGIGGTNAHVILQEAPPAAARSGESDQAFQVLTLSAKSASALDAMTNNLASYLRDHPDARLADIACTLQLGRTDFPHRRVVVSDRVAGALEALTTLPATRSSTGMPAPAARINYLFPGQGLQQVNMGRDLYESEAVFRDCVDHCARLLEPLMALDVRMVLYPHADNTDAARERLMQTSVTQPALFVVEYALVQQLAHWGVRPHAMMGHSLGEYVAACVAGVMSLPDALKLVCMRGQLIQALPGGSMLAVEASAQELAPYLAGAVDLAVVNAARACVLAGPAEHIDAVQTTLENKGLRCKRVATSHAFHSAMLDPVLDRFLATVSQVELRAPQIPYITNVTGTWVTHAQATDPAHWVRHMRQTVRFAEGLDTLLQTPDGLFVEVGPGHTFTSIIRRHADNAHARVATATLSGAAGWSDCGALALAVGRLWVAGVTPAWAMLHEDATRQRAPLPGYPFERQRFWPQARNVVRAATTHADQTAIEPAQTHSGDASAVSSHDTIEAKLAAIFAEVLGLPSVALTDNFFELGGSSLSALSVILQVEQMLGQKLPTSAMLESPTVATLAAALRTMRDPRSQQLVGMRTTGALPPLICIHPYGGHTTNYVELTRSLGGEQPVYGIQAGGLQGESTPLRTIEAMASDYIDLMKTVQPQGPYRLIGHSMGGCIAYEMAQQLQQRGESVALLALLDSRAQNASVQPLYRNGTYGKMAARAWLSDEAVMLGILMPKLAFDWESLRDVPTDVHWRHVLEAATQQGLLPAGTGERQIRQVLAVIDANDEALRTYRPAPYSGRVLLCCGEDGFAQQFGEPDLGWGVLAASLDLVRVAGDHHSIMSRENAATIAQHLERHAQPRSA
ncbi:non-ribosomal peptide synthetase/type I polyketide synthase [Paraburkholderia sp. Ac-20340]|uniref:non-ribosomal peptide synthetase/type I polyketide synthase n=1 Tax=Paraburkholderia sp. Ac-20340 TaxID=2703888 RepID=UPI002402B7B2|nr:non-ribosomal peptide synthetase/type I polyketide synthase [Paraburkholderia sp. Ac-20340]